MINYSSTHSFDHHTHIHNPSLFPALSLLNLSGCHYLFISSWYPAPKASFHLISQYIWTDFCPESSVKCPYPFHFPNLSIICLYKSKKPFFRIRGTMTDHLASLHFHNSQPTQAGTYHFSSFFVLFIPLKLYWETSLRVWSHILKWRVSDTLGKKNNGLAHGILKYFDSKVGRTSWLEY